MHSITVYFFASVREHMGCSSLTLEIPTSVRTLSDLKNYLFNQEGAWQSLAAQLPTLLFAINQELAETETDPIPNGAEIAIFPPVTGG